jgi:putative peptidoglycan lipid II flippase
MSHQASRPERAGRIVKDSAVISGFSALGFASALMVDIIIAARFGLGRETDAFFVAFTVPQLVASILLVAANVALVPVFAEIQVKEGKAQLWHVSSNLMNLSLVGGAALGLVGCLGAPLLIQVLGAGLDKQTQALATSLSAIVFLMVIPLGGIEVFRAVLNSLGSFGAPAGAALIRNLGTALAVVLLGRDLGIHSLALGYVGATWLQFVCLGGILTAKGFRYRLVLDRREVWVVKALHQIRPPVMGAMLGQSNILLERFLASFLSPGIVSALVYARRILRAADDIFLGSISTALLPRLSTLFVQSQTSGFRRSLSLGIKLATIISFPVAVGIISLNVPLVQLLFQRGAFDQETAHMTARLLALYIMGIPPVALSQILISSYYASGDTRTPFHIRVVMLILNIGLDIALFLMFDSIGLPLALSLTRMIILVLVVWLLRSRLQPLSSELISFVVKVGLASAIMGLLVFWLYGTVLQHLGGSSTFALALRLLTSAATGSVVYVALLLALRVEEMGQMIQAMLRRFKLVRNI